MAAQALEEARASRMLAALPAIYTSAQLKYTIGDPVNTQMKARDIIAISMAHTTGALDASIEPSMLP